MFTRVVTELPLKLALRVSACLSLLVRREDDLITAFSSPVVVLTVSEYKSMFVTLSTGDCGVHSLVFASRND